MYNVIKRALSLLFLVLGNFAFLYGSTIQHYYDADAKACEYDVKKNHCSGNDHLVRQDLRAVGVAKAALGDFSKLPSSIVLYLFTFVGHDWGCSATIPLRHGDKWIEDQIRDVEACGNNRIAVLKEGGKAIYLYDAEKHTCVATIFAERPQIFGTIKYIPACCTLAVAMSWNEEPGRLVKMFSPEDGKYEGNIRCNSGAPISSSAVISDRYLAFGKSGSGEIEIIDIGPRKLIKVFDGTKLVPWERSVVGLSNDRIASLHRCPKPDITQRSSSGGGFDLRSFYTDRGFADLSVFGTGGFDDRASQFLKKCCLTIKIRNARTSDGLKEVAVIGDDRGEGLLEALSDKSTLVFCFGKRANIISTVGDPRVIKTITIVEGPSSHNEISLILMALSGAKFAVAQNYNHLHIWDSSSEQELHCLSGKPEGQYRSLSYIKKLAKLDNGTIVACGKSKWMMLYKHTLNVDYRIFTKPLKATPLLSEPAHEENTPEKEKEREITQKEKLSNAHQDQVQFYKEKFTADPGSIPAPGKRSKLHQEALDEMGIK